ncbi:unnamed protein product [Enterobius vermicularis]|uniref:Transmembrane protein n=1 Tax=Enterobius vermicularis TaxID=51028 RepID=A0A0N4VA58_ENTVE|nr:unnamed protein product [Enterobius vermicularis]
MNEINEPAKMVYFSLHEWLTTPTRGPRDRATNAKRALVTLLLFILPLTAAVVENVVIDMYYLPFPVWLHWIIYAFEFLAFIALVYGLFKEKTELILPFIIIESIKLLIWGGYTIFYLIRLIINEVNGEGGSFEPKTAVVPGIMSVKTDYYEDEYGRIRFGASDHWSNSWLSKVVNHLAILSTIHVITVCAAVSVYQAIHHILHNEERQRLATPHTVNTVTVPQSLENETVATTTKTTTQQNPVRKEMFMQHLVEVGGEATHGRVSMEESIF